MSWDLAWLEFLEEQELPHGARQRFLQKITASAPEAQAPRHGAACRDGYNVRGPEWMSSAAGRVMASCDQGIQ